MAEWDPEKNFESLTHEVAINDGDYSKAAKRIFEESAPIAAQAITHLALYSVNEKIRLDASRYIIDRCLGRADNTPQGSGEDGDVFDKLLKDVVRDSASN